MSSLKEDLKTDQTYNPKDEEVLNEVLGMEEETLDEDDRVAKLERLGFKNAVKKVGKAEKMAHAYKMYLYVTEEDIKTFNKKLKEETKKEDENAYYFKELTFTEIKDYGEVPPDHVLTAIEEAQKTDCFDRYEIAKIEWRNQPKIPDPIVFGRIDGCSDYFFIAQWDDDVSIEDILNVGKEKK